MKRTVLTFGLISGAILSAMMIATIPFHETIGYDRGEVIGYTTMILSFLFIFFGIRSYRENIGGGSITFTRALKVGALIALISSICYVATWEVLYFKFIPDFGEKYQAHLVEKARSSGASQAEIEATAARNAKFAAWYKNPLINIAITFVEPLPLGLLVALVSAGILRRRPRADGAAALVTA